MSALAPASFAGSVPLAFSEDRAIARLLDGAGAAASLTIGLLAGMAGVLAHLAWNLCLGAGCLALLLAASAGLWLMRRAGALSGLGVSRLYDRVMHSLQASPDGSQTAPDGPEHPIDSFAGLVGGTVRQLGRSVAAHARTRNAARAASQALQAGRDQASRIASNLRGEEDAMASAASGILAASAGLAADAAQTSNGAAVTEDAVSKVAAQAIGLAGSVRDVTTQVTRMTEVARGAAAAAQGAQTHLAGLDARTRGLEGAASGIARALQMASACGREASSQAASGQPVSASLAASLQDLAGFADEALGAMLSIVTGLRAESAAAGNRVAEMAALIHSQHELGNSLARFVGQQGDHIAHVLGLVEEAHAGFAAVRAGVDAMSSRNSAQLAEAEALRRSLGRLPAHADTIASILRAIPDFTPPPREF